jgi:hypothetical protein
VYSRLGNTVVRSSLIGWDIFHEFCGTQICILLSMRLYKYKELSSSSSKDFSTVQWLSFTQNQVSPYACVSSILFCQSVVCHASSYSIHPTLFGSSLSSRSVWFPF